MRGSIATIGILALLIAGCSDDSNPVSTPTESTVLVGSGFETGMDGWDGGSHATNFGTVTWHEWEGGVIKLDGVGFDGDPNAWVSKEIAIPAGARTLRIATSAHNRGDGEVSLRIRAVDESETSHTILDWDPLSTGDEGFEFVKQSFDISEFAGQTVTLFFEIGDIDGGGNNQRYIDYIEIHR